MNENFKEEIYEEIYAEERLYEKAVGAAIIITIIGFIFSIAGSIAMAVTTTQTMGIKGLLYTVISIVPAILVVAVMLFVVTGGFVYGWKYLTPVFDFFGWFLYLPIAGWFVFFAIKFVISIGIGWIFFVYQVIIRLIDKIRDRKNSEEKER